MQARPEERLVGVDVADPGDARLVEQERLERRGASRRHRAQRLWRERGRERLDPEPLEALLELGVVDQERLAEAAWVGEPELATVVEPEAGAQVALRGGALALIQPAPLGWIELPPRPRPGPGCRSSAGA